MKRYVTYETNTSLNLEDFCKKLKDVTFTGGTVIVITKSDNGLCHRKAM